ncbi:MAG TPA: heavy metal translocating P-type ATPase [Actinomycetota bacterium]|nr:heavy metal translocating P-type ATPase [Actinomycetota bacterium]
MALGSRDLSRVWLATSILGLATGGVLAWMGQPDAANIAWAVTTAVALVSLLRDVVIGLLRRQPGVDVIALLAMGGSLALEEYLAGAVIALMLASGEALEAFADRRAHRELSALLERAPRTVSRYEGNDLVERPVGEVRRGDRLLVKPGAVIPVDGIASTHAVLDEAALTGESRPVERAAGDPIRSGAVNAGGAFDLLATTTAEGSTYAGIVRLVREAERQKAPFVRLADRYAAIFVPITLVVAGVAWVAGDATRALSVLVVATPCPLLLAVPISIVSGISRAAHRGIIVKGGGVLETLARAKVLVLDKTGTLTSGVPEVSDIETFPGGDGFGLDGVLRLAASLDQVSPHLLAAALVRAARARGLELSFPTDVRERHGSGIEGTVDGHRVALGKSSYVSEGAPMPPRAREVRRRSMLDGSSCVFVAIDGTVAGALIIDDPIRPDAPRVIRSLRRAGIERVIMVTGDHPDVAESVGAALGVDRIMSERDPSEKVEALEAEREAGVVVMVGDGLNDAPALAAADVGVAMGARGATASSEAADAVLVADRLDGLVDAIAIARRSRAIAIQSVVMGMGLAFAFMIGGALGLFRPAVGALIQELIDVAAILNALRALSGGGRPVAGRETTDVAERFRAEHREFAPELARVRSVADRLGELAPGDVRRELEAVRRFVVERLPQHEEEEEAAVYPVVARLLGGEDPMSSMARAHLEISHLARVFRQLLDDLPEDGPTPDDLVDLRRVLYGLYAILRLHFAQEDEAYAWLSSGEESVPVA